MAATTTFSDALRSVGHKDSSTIEAVTPAGKGTITPLSKACSHLLLVYTAVDDKWQMPTKTAAKEMTEATLHISAILWPENLLTPETKAQGEKWAANVAKITDTINKLAVDATDKAYIHATLTAPDLSTLKALITESWQLLARFDLELTGLKVNDVDPGTAR